MSQFKDEEFSFLTSILSAEKPSIRIELFESKYLPMMLDPNPAKFNLHWINEVAMSPYLEVNVVNANGGVEYTTPPLRSPTKTTTKNNIQYLANYALMESKIHMLRAQMILSENLPKMIRFETGIDPEYEYRWRQILIRHGYGHMLPDKEHDVQHDGKVAIMSDSIIDLEDDDW